MADLQAGRKKFTRRQALSMVMALYDPMGLVGPALVTGKLLLRRLYSPSQVSSWDEDLPWAREAEVGELVRRVTGLKRGHIPQND